MHAFNSAAGMSRADSKCSPRPAWVVVLLATAAFPQLSLADDLQLRPLRGPHPVGYRQEVITNEANDTDELVEVWYPSAGKNPATPYLDSKTAEIWGERLDLSLSLESDILLDRAADAPWSNQEQWPVLLFFPGLSWPVGTYQSLLCSLASHGFVIVAVHNPGGNDPVVFPDGRVVRFDFWPEGFDFNDEAARDAFLLQKQEEWKERLRGVLDWLERRAAKAVGGDHWSTSLDLDRIGVIGHSFGGSAGVALLLEDDRVAAGVCVEGANYWRRVSTDSPPGSTSIARPLMNIMGAGDRSKYFGAFRTVNQPLYELIVEGTSHSSLADHPTLQLATTPEEWKEAFPRAIEPTRAHEVFQAYILAFFDRFLRDADSELLHSVSGRSSSGYPEAELVIDY